MAWLSSASGVKDAAIRKYLKGSQPTIIPACAIATALGVRIDWLIANIGPMTGPKELPRAPLPRETLFRPADFACAFIPFYDLSSANHVLAGVGVTADKSFPVASAWIARLCGDFEGIWATSPTDDDLSSVAFAGDILICRPAFMPVLGRVYVFSYGGTNQIRRFAMSAPGDASGEALVNDRADSPPIPVNAAPTLIGEVLGVVSAAPVQPEPHYQRPNAAS